MKYCFIVNFPNYTFNMTLPREIRLLPLAENTPIKGIYWGVVYCYWSVYCNIFYLLQIQMFPYPNV